MLNNKGWGLRVFIGLLVFFGIMILISVSLQSRLGLLFNPLPSVDDINKVEDKEKDKVEVKDIVEVKDKIDVKKYNKLENKVIAATKKYTKKYLKKEDIINESIVRLTFLKKENFIKDFKDPYSNLDCSGYGSIIKTDDKLEYKAYIKCGDNYTTQGYIKELD